jgi:CBS domain-containing protein
MEPAAGRARRGMLMLISQILRTKRSDVVTISPDAAIDSAIALMTREHVGALLVVDRDQRLMGVISERDIIHNLHSRGTDLMHAQVSSVMRTDGPVAAIEDTVLSVMEVMTASRARHVPILKYGRPIGIVSVGDVVKSRLDETIQENSVLRDFARVHWLTS